MSRSRRSEKAAPEEFIQDWAFHVPLPAFLSALDITRSERVRTKVLADGTKKRVSRYVWTQGDPPAYRFSVGDMFYKPNRPNTDWAEQLKYLEHSIQIQALAGDEIEIEIIEYPSWKRGRSNISADRLALVLKSGDVPE